MENVLPSPERETDPQSWRIRFFNPVTVLVGEPLDLSATVADLRARGASAVRKFSGCIALLNELCTYM